MNKTKLFIDIDETITNSIKAFCHCYNLIYCFEPNFTYANWELVNEWNFQDQCTLIKTDDEIEKIFGLGTFFANLNFINENTYDILKELNEKYHIILCSIGTYDNISNKTLWVKRNLPFIESFIFLDKKFSKSNIMMNNGIFIDDNVENLRSNCTADLKICFGKIYNWNSNWQGIRCPDWSSIAQKLL